MNISVITLFPELYDSFIKTSLIKRAVENNTININLTNLFSFAKPKNRIDSPTFGPGAGMLIKPEVVSTAIEEQESRHGKAFKIFFSPAGKKLDQDLLRDIASKKLSHIMMLPARYEGMDARVEEHYADLVLSIGDYVLMGGDLPAMVFLEGFLRLLPGVVGKAESVEHDSFTGPFVDFGQYTEPLEFKGLKVPDVIRSGNHEEIRKFRYQDSLKKTLLHHFEWLRTHISKKEDILNVQRIMPHHYAVLMHNNVIVESLDSVTNTKHAIEGNSSVTSLDIHDIARSAFTYGLINYFLVSSLIDQQKIIKKLIGFWVTESGIEYNVHRHMAVSRVILKDNLSDVIAQIEEKENKKPILIATSAKKYDENYSKKFITYFDQEKIWALQRPVLFVFGTAQGLGKSVIDQCDYLLEPVTGFSDFNHLSVRSAAAIIFDRWLGINPRKSDVK